MLILLWMVTISRFPLATLILMWVFFSFQVARRPVHPPWPAPAAGAQAPPMDAHAHDDSGDDDDAPLEAPPEGLNEGLVDDAPEHEPVPTARKKRIVADLHTRLATHFPDYFHRVEEAVPYYEIKSDPAAPLLIVDPDFSRSWLRPPVPKPEDTWVLAGQELQVAAHQEDPLPTNYQG